MSFDEARIKQEDGTVRSLTSAQFFSLGLAERITCLSTNRVQFFEQGKLVPPLDALRKPKAADAP